MHQFSNHGVVGNSKVTTAGGGSAATAACERSPAATAAAGGAADADVCAVGEAGAEADDVDEWWGAAGGDEGLGVGVGVGRGESV